MTLGWNPDLLLSFLQDETIANDFLEAFISLNPRFKDSTPNPKEILLNDKIYLHYNDFCENPIERIILQNLNTINPLRCKKKIILKDVFDKVQAFYGSCDSIIYEPFKQIWAQKDGRIRSVRPRKNTIYSGSFYFSTKAQDFLIDFTNFKNFATIGTFTHEIGHAVGFVMREYQTAPKQYDAFSEVESIFPELLACYYFAQDKQLQSEALAFETILYNDFIVSAMDMLKKFDCAFLTSQMLKKYDDFTFSEFERKARQEININSWDLSKLSSFSARGLLPYVYSQLIAIELLYIYFENPHEAFNIYRKIILLKQKKPAK